jgi:hypothetical protein
MSGRVEHVAGDGSAVWERRGRCEQCGHCVNASVNSICMHSASPKRAARSPVATRAPARNVSVRGTAASETIKRGEKSAQT